MKSGLLIVGGVVALLCSPGEAEELRYWGARPDLSVGWVQLGDEQYYEITVGSDIPAWGRVREIGADRLIVEQVTPEAEKARLRETGALVHDVLEIHIPHEGRRFPGR